jgi:hypothetical protein
MDSRLNSLTRELYVAKQEALAGKILAYLASGDLRFAFDTASQTRRELRQQ